MLTPEFYLDTKLEETEPAENLRQIGILHKNCQYQLKISEKL